MMEVSGRTADKIFVSTRKLILLAFLAVVIIIASGTLGGFLGPSKLKGGSDVSTSGRIHVLASTTTIPEKSTNKPPGRDVWNRRRLPDWIFPVHYNLTVRVNISANYFNGSVDIDIQCMKRSRYVLLHCKKLNIRSLKVVYADGTTVNIKRYFMFPENDYCVIEVEPYLEIGKAIITVIFDAIMSPDLNGLYTSNYPELDGSTGTVAATFYAPVAARKNFPCFDEPALKANFTVNLIHDKKYSAISNMPMTRKTIGSDGHVRSNFKTSVKMSTYLLCFVVGNFGYSENTTQNGVKIRVWAPKHLVRQTHYSLRAAIHILTYFENRFGIRYPLAKVDMIALPNFMAGAMENWGLITYRSTRLLTRFNSSSEKERQNILTIVSHELAHQWFGNLVTMEWWNDVWLNEGFASYIEYLGANSFEPSMNLMDQFLLLDLYPVMQLDALKSSHPLSMEVETAISINQIFDTITYNKGASVIRMMKEFMGEEKFMRGLKNYLLKYAYKNANQDNLWEELRKVSNVDIKKIMDTWTLQLGFPTVTVSRTDSKRVKVTQERFSLDQGSNGLQPSPLNYTWHVPITYVMEKAPQKTHFVFLGSKEMSLDIPDDGWYKLNKDHAGYFRVMYEESNWKKLTAQLFKDHTVFTAMDRANLIDDIFNMAYAGKVSYRIALESTKYLKKETEWVPWKTGIDSVSRMNRMLSKTCTTKKLIIKYLDSLVSPVVDILGWGEQRRVSDSYLQTTAISIAGHTGNQNVTSRAVQYFRNWMKKGQEIPAKYAKLVYFLGVKDGGVEEWDRVFKEYQTTTNIAEKKSLLSALGATQSPWVMQRFLEYSLDETKIAKEDGTAAIIAAAKGSSDGRFLAWEFLQANWKKILEQYGDGIFLLGRMINGVISDFSNQYELNMVEKFFQGKQDLQPARRAISQAIENIKGNISWKKKHEDDVKLWLMKTMSH